ncbi:MAG: putative porin [Pseudomonadota bacterium]|nr:putative porin [Pseudomonadota bacterium]
MSQLRRFKRQSKFSCLLPLLGVVGLLQGATLTAGELTETDLLNMLLDNDIITREQAQQLVDKVHQRRGAPPAAKTGMAGMESRIKAADIMDMLRDEGLISEQSYQQMQERLRQRETAIKAGKGDDAAAGDVRVPYLPDYIREDMEQSIRQRVEVDVVEKVKDEAVRTARVYGWGIKEAPSWVHKVKISGDGRLRYQADMFPDDNAIYGYPDYVAINESGEEVYDNVNDNRYRFLTRFRLMVKAQATDRIELGMRITTGNEGNPVSSNQTLGDFSSKWDANFDLGYLKYTSLEEEVELLGGRFKNPFLHTDLVYDSDMTFEGIGGSYYFLRESSPFSDENSWDPFVTIGAFPLQEIHSSIANLSEDAAKLVSETNDRDKYLYAIQFGTHYEFLNTSKLSMALSYYHYDQIEGKRNPYEGTDATYETASPYYQVGNSVFNINHPNDDPQIGLAASFKLVNATVKYTMADFFPTYVFLQADYVKNIAFDQEQVSALVGRDVPDRDTGYQFGIAAGTATLSYIRDWRVSFTYRHLEGDAVLDAFADSDFLLGGTDAEGYILEADYLLYDNLVSTLRWISADSIDTDPDDQLYNISVDTLQLSLQASF